MYVRIFLCTGISFGLVECAVQAILVGSRRGWDAALDQGLRAGLLAGLLFGAAMSATLGTMALLATRRQGTGALLVRQQRRIELRGARDDVIRTVAGALSRIPGAGGPRFDALAGLVEVRTAWSWKSFGELVTARIEAAGPGLHLVHVESRPRLRTTIVDYGANAANADAALALLQAG